MFTGCKKCRMATAVLFLALGVLFLLRDLSVWNFWNVQWWTALFLLMGICGICMHTCPECCMTMPETKKRR